MMTPHRTAIRFAAMLVFAASVAAFAMPITDFNKFSSGAERGTYLSGAASMLAYDYAAQGQQQKAKCVHNWYFKDVVNKDGTKSPPRGPVEM